jgi:hypothetical protein
VEALEENPGRFAQCRSQLGHDQDRGVSNPALDAAHIGTVETALEGQILLGPALFPPQFLDVQAKLASYIHADSGRLRSQLIYSR